MALPWGLYWGYSKVRSPPRATPWSMAMNGARFFVNDEARCPNAARERTPGYRERSSPRSWRHTFPIRPRKKEKVSRLTSTHFLKKSRLFKLRRLFGFLDQSVARPIKIFSLLFHGGIKMNAFRIQPNPFKSSTRHTT